MVEGAAKSPRKEAIRLSKLLEISLGSERFPVDVAALAKEVSRNYGDPIDKIVGDELPGFEGMLRPHKKRPAWHIVYSTNPQYRGASVSQSPTSSGTTCSTGRNFPPRIIRMAC